MSADMSHAEPMANQLAEIIVSVLNKHGYERPDNFFGMGTKWDTEVGKLRASLQEMIELDAAAKF